jgi:aminoglycoside phosphotransferase (APT) family kinase protein
VERQNISPHMGLAAFPVDLALPQVEIASNAALMREVFRTYLRPFSGKTYHIQDCILTRIRHRQAARCILQYNLRLVDSATGRERIQWVTGVIYPKDRAEHIWQRLRAADVQEQISADFRTFEPVSFIPELKMLVQLFPYDRRLPALPFLISGPSAEIESLLLAGFGPGSWYAEGWNVEPIRYRAGLAVVLRYTVEARDSETSKREKKRFYAKIYRDEKGEQIYQVLQALWGRDNARGKYFTVARPITYLNDLHALVQEEASGISFQDILLNGQDDEAVSAARKVARALAALHLDQISTTRHHRLQDEIATLEKIRETLQWAAPLLREELGVIVRSIVASLEEVPLRPTHLDLKTDHILLEGDRCTLLDFDSFGLADPILDVAHALAQIVGLKFRLAAPHDRLRMAACAFTEEYFNHVPGNWRSRLPSHCAGAALKVALGFFRRQEPQWPEKVSTLIAEAKASLAGKGMWRDFSPPYRPQIDGADPVVAMSVQVGR